MIGDSLAADVQGGQNAGLAATVWVNRSGAARPPQARLCGSGAAAVCDAGLAVGVWGYAPERTTCLPQAWLCGLGAYKSWFLTVVGCPAAQNRVVVCVDGHWTLGI